LALLFLGKLGSRIARREDRQDGGEDAPLRTRLTRLRYEPLVEREASAALSMLDQIEERYARFEALLCEKLPHGEKFHDRFLSAGSGVYSSVQSALKESASLVEQILTRRTSRRGHTETSLERLTELLTASHYAIDRFDVINSALPRLAGDGRPRIEASLTELEKLVVFAKKHSA
jgi:hypothetical protein